MHLISLAGSERQKSKLRNGHKVRIKHGAGFNVIVNPSTYHLVSKAFNKNKGVQIQLTPEEIAMNKAPSPEMQAQIMGHNEHMILPNTHGALVKGSGIGDWFKNVGNTIKSGWENTIQKPIEQQIIKPVQEKIIAPAKGLYNQYVKPYESDIKTGLKLTNPLYGYSADFVKQLAMGKKPGEIVKTWGADLQHLNQTKNKIIRSDPILTEAYKNAMPKLAGLATGSLAGTMGLNPVLAGAAGVAGERLGQRALEAEGYGLHHAIRLGLHHHPELHRHRKPIAGGKIGFHHVTNFFKNAGENVKKWVNNTFVPAVKTGYSHAKQGAHIAHNWLLDHPEIAELIKHHGSKLAGLAAKEGVKYLGGSDALADIAGDTVNDAAHTGFEEHLGYGLGGALSFMSKKKQKQKEQEQAQTNASVHNFLTQTNVPEHLRHLDPHMQRYEMGRIEAKKIQAEGDRRREENRKEMDAYWANPDRNKKSVPEPPSYSPEPPPVFDHPDHPEENKKSKKELKKYTDKHGNSYTSDELFDIKYGRNGNAYKDPRTSIEGSYRPKEKEASFWSKLTDWWSGPKAQPEQDYKTTETYTRDPAEWAKKWGSGLYSGGGGLYAGQKGGEIGSPFIHHNMQGHGFDSYNSIHAMNVGTAIANAHLGKLSHRTVEGQIHQEPIKKYWDGEGQPPSRGTGIHPHHHSHIYGTEHLHNRGNGFGSHDHHNLMGGRGRLLEHSASLPVALVSQPYGTNFHMQFQLPPEYHKFNDGTYTF